MNWWEKIKSKLKSNKKTYEVIVEIRLIPGKSGGPLEIPVKIESEDIEESISKMADRLLNSPSYLHVFNEDSSISVPIQNVKELAITHDNNTRLFLSKL